MSRILVISPHPDDEAIGCGGVLRSHAIDGDFVYSVFLTSGENGGHGRPPQETARIREAEAVNAGEILGLARLDFWRQPDGALHATRQLVARMRRTIDAYEPDLLYVTHDREMHPDHRAAARMVRRALTGADAPARKPVVRMYEVWTPMQKMDEIVDISPFMETKIKAIQAHRTQCDVVRFDEAVVGLNRYRGELHSWPGGDYAEIFLKMRL